MMNSHRYHLSGSTLILGASWVSLNVYSIPLSKQNSPRWDARSAASHLGLYCHKKEPGIYEFKNTKILGGWNNNTCISCFSHHMIDRLISISLNGFNFPIRHFIKRRNRFVYSGYNYVWH